MSRVPENMNGMEDKIQGSRGYVKIKDTDRVSTND